MRYTPLLFLVLTACGSSTDTSPTRYNFAVVDGRNQSSTAGANTLPAPITSQLTRDPQGKFALGVINFLLPTVAYAQQQIPLSGEPVEGAIVCGRVAPTGEPQVEPLCAFTLSDGKAANVVKPGTKAGIFNIVFTAQVQSQEPVKDSTTVTVLAGAVTVNSYAGGRVDFGESPFSVDPNGNLVQDQYGNPVPYRLAPSLEFAHPVSAVIGEAGSRTLIADKDGSGFIGIVTAGGTITSGRLTVSGTGTTSSVIRLEFVSQ